MPNADRSPVPRPASALADRLRRLVEAAGGPPLAAPPRLDAVIEGWWGLPPRVRQVLVVASTVGLLLLPATAALRSPWGPTRTVAVLAADVGWAGLVAGAVAPAQRPLAVLPDDALTPDDLDALRGRLRGPLPAGTILRRSHLMPDSGALEVGPGRSAVPLRADLIPPEVDAGATVDVVAAGVDGRGHVLARSARVLRATVDAVWLEVARDEAVAVAGADGVDAIRLVLVAS